MPNGRHEVTLAKWKSALPYLDMAIKANQHFEEGNIEKSQKMIIESMCGTIASLSDGIELHELIQVDKDKINNLFLMQFNWLSSESPKREFKINGKRFIVPQFAENSCGDFMDCMDLLSAYQEYDESEKGLVVAAIYMRQGEYYQDLQEIEQRVEFLKEHGRMDLFYSCAFFLLSSLRTYKIDTQRHSNLKEELKTLSSTLNGWATTLYLQTLQNRVYSRIPR